MPARRWILAALVAAGGCARDEAPKAPAPAPAPPREVPPEPAPAPEPMQVVPPWLAAAVDRGITPPPERGSTYHVDPFVAALVVEQARAGDLPVVHLEDQSGGYRVDSPDPNGLLARLGIRGGDVIEAVNGSQLSSPDAVIPALAESHDRVVVELRREDYSMTLSYRLVGGMGWARALAAFGAGAAPRPPIASAPEATAPEPEAVDEPRGPDVAPASTPRRPHGSRPSSRPPSSRPAPGSRPPGNGSGSRSVRCASSTQCEIDRATFDRLAQDPSRLQSQASIVPAIRDDIQSGYKLKTVRPGTDVHALGFRSGDKITHINGHFLGDDGQAMSLYFKLPATRVFNIRYERGGRRLTKRVTVR